MSSRTAILEVLVGEAWEANFTANIFGGELEIDHAFEATFESDSESLADCGDEYDVVATGYDPYAARYSEAYIASLLRT